MKRVVFAVLFCSLILLSACDYADFIYWERESEIIQIELIYYDNPQAREYPREEIPLRISKEQSDFTK